MTAVALAGRVSAGGLSTALDPTSSSADSDLRLFRASWNDDSDLYRVLLTRSRLGGTRARVWYLSWPKIPVQLIANFRRPTTPEARAEAEALIEEEQQRHGDGRPARVTWIDRTSKNSPAPGAPGAGGAP